MIKKLVHQHESEIIAFRRHFHSNPEPSWGEHETAAYIRSVLDAHGISNTSIAGTGVIAVIEGTAPGRTVALRADTDALKVTEANTLDYKSKNEGLMHACGHDGHAAMLLGTAIILNQIRDRIKGRIKLLFQPAEEMVEGAKLMIEEGALDGVETIFGIHLWSGLDTGKISIEPGAQMASGDYVIVDITGKGGHGSMPHQTVDASLMAAAFITEIQAVVSRETNPLDPLVLTFGEIKSGSRFNVISGKAHLEGTARCYDPNIRAALPEIITRYGTSLCAAYGGQFELEFRPGTPPTINDKATVDLAQSTVLKLFGESCLTYQERTTGSEDMAYYLEQIPGAIAFVGTGNADKDTLFPHHHPNFNIDEDSLAIGTELYLQFALDYLNQ